MRRSDMFLQTQKMNGKGGAEALTASGHINQVSAGIYNLSSLGLSVLRKIESIVREEMAKLAQEIQLTNLQEDSIWQKTGRLMKMAEILFKTGRFVLGATHEEAISNWAAKWIKSHRDLDRAVFQFGTKFRNEKRARAGMIRLVEFLMKDAYSFHKDQAGLDAFFEKMAEAYQRVWERLGIAHLTYKTYASGGDYSKAFSVEFQTLCSIGEDAIHICDKCGVAFNEEIIFEIGHKCTQCGNTELRTERAVEVGNIFKLGEKFSRDFGIKFTDTDGQSKHVQMGCYGIGISRLIGVLAELFHDDKGLCLGHMSAFQVNLISIGKKDETIEVAEKLYQQLTTAGIETLYDDRQQVNAGAKFIDADMIGCTWQVVVSDRLGDKAEIKNRQTGETVTVNMNEVVNFFKK